MSDQITWSEIIRLLHDHGIEDVYRPPLAFPSDIAAGEKLLAWLGNVIDEVTNQEILELRDTVDDLEDDLRIQESSHEDELQELREQCEEEIEAARRDLGEVRAPLRAEIATLKAELEDYRRQNDVERDGIVRENVPTSWDRILEGL